MGPLYSKHTFRHIYGVRSVVGVIGAHLSAIPGGEVMYRKFSVWPALAMALLVGACSDNNPTLVEKGREPTAPKLATAPVGARWGLYTNQTPTETLDATPGWEVSTRFA